MEARQVSGKMSSMKREMWKYSFLTYTVQFWDSKILKLSYGQIRVGALISEDNSMTAKYKERQKFSTLEDCNELQTVEDVMLWKGNNREEFKLSLQVDGLDKPANTQLAMETNMEKPNTAYSFIFIWWLSKEVALTNNLMLWIFPFCKTLERVNHPFLHSTLPNNYGVFFEPQKASPRPCPGRSQRL